MLKKTTCIPRPIMPKRTRSLAGAGDAVIVSSLCCWYRRVVGRLRLTISFARVWRPS